MSELPRLLMQRGHEVTKEGTDRDILIPETADPELRESFKTLLYNLLKRDSFADVRTLET